MASDPEVCLTCTLPKCVSDPGGPPLELCAYEQAVKGRGPGPQVPDGYMSISQARKVLGIGYEKLRGMVRRGECPGRRIGHSKRATIAIPIEWINDFNK